jgi:hypothetical protein
LFFVAAPRATKKNNPKFLFFTLSVGTEDRFQATCPLLNPFRG